MSLRSEAVSDRMPSDLSPSSAAKREAIVQAAAQVFMKAGYGAASMDQIAAEAGVSKQTVYSHFGAKDALFEEIISGKCVELLGTEDAGFGQGDDPYAVLFETAKQFLNIVLSDESMTLYRMILGECGRFPELATVFYRAGPRTATERLSRFLSKMADQGYLKIDNPAAAAGLFFAMMRGDLYLRCMLGLRDRPDAAEITDYARTVAETFIRAHKIEEKSA
jgi:TetR/AcrR family transcriptional regulator, mexJK operon transcriptional repressor